MKKVCTKCLKEKDKSEFSKSVSRKDGYNYKCKMCHKEYRETHYQKNRQKYIEKSKRKRKEYRQEFLEFIKTKSCIDCGNSDWRVLEFDHIHNKEYNISAKKSQITLKSLMKEIDKCDIVCANCHRIRSHNRYGYYKHY